MNLPDPYVWLDPADAVFVAGCREALNMERRAWEACHAERLQLAEKLARKEATLPIRKTRAGYPAVRSPRARYRRRGDLQDTVVLELHVPAAQIPWFEFFADWFGPGVEKTAITLLTFQLMRLQEDIHAGSYGGREALAAILAAVDRFHSEPVNCGPEADDPRKGGAPAFIRQMHGEEL